MHADVPKEGFQLTDLSVDDLVVTVSSLQEVANCDYIAIIFYQTKVDILEFLVIGIICMRNPVSL
jgi:hypothetical protein